MQRRRDLFGVQDVGYRNEVALVRVRVQARMPPQGDRDLGHLLGRRAVFMHMALRDERVQRRHQRAVRNFELRLGAAAFGHFLDRTRPRAVREQILPGHAQHRRALSRGDGHGSLMNHAAA